MTSTRLAERAPTIEGPRPAGASRPGVRSQILEAALLEFAERGFQEASLAAIARRVGVTAPLVLYHFGSKANLWRETLEMFCASFAAVVDEAVEDGASFGGRDAFRLLVRRLVHFFAGSRAGYRLMRDEGTGGPGCESVASRSLKPVIGWIEGVYDRAVAEGAMRPAPFETTFFMILGAMSCYLESRSLAAQLFGDHAPTDKEDWVDAYADQVLGLCFDGLAQPMRRTESPRPMLAALRAAPRSTNSAAVTEGARA